MVWAVIRRWIHSDPKLHCHYAHQLLIQGRMNQGLHVVSGPDTWMLQTKSRHIKPDKVFPVNFGEHVQTVAPGVVSRCCSQSASTFNVFCAFRDALQHALVSELLLLVLSWQNNQLFRLLLPVWSDLSILLLHLESTRYFLPENCCSLSFFGPLSVDPRDGYVHKYQQLVNYSDQPIWCFMLQSESLKSFFPHSHARFSFNRSSWSCLHE